MLGGGLYLLGPAIHGHGEIRGLDLLGERHALRDDAQVQQKDCYVAPVSIESIWRDRSLLATTIRR